jgi:hypothetical protein
MCERCCLLFAKDCLELTKMQPGEVLCTGRLPGKRTGGRTKVKFSFPDIRTIVA